MTIKELVKDNMVEFDSYRQGHFYYNLYVKMDTPENGVIFQFPVPLEDIGTATLLKEDKAITFMRWIRKAQDDKTLIELR
jgi:hypothetical protein